MRWTVESGTSFTCTGGAVVKDDDDDDGGSNRDGLLILSLMKPLSCELDNGKNNRFISSS